jgi:glycosyltransferase involved in cell wall biosynthesis
LRAFSTKATPGLEYLVLDDGSRDDTPAVAAHYAGRIRYLRHSNMGKARTVSRGFAEAQGELLAVVNSDDPVRPGFLAAMVAALAANPGALVAYPDGAVPDRESWVIGVQSAAEHEYELIAVANRSYVGSCAMFKRCLIGVVCGRDPQSRQVGDIDFWPRANLP